MLQVPYVHQNPSHPIGSQLRQLPDDQAPFSSTWIPNLSPVVLRDIRGEYSLVQMYTPSGPTSIEGWLKSAYLQPTLFCTATHPTIPHGTQLREGPDADAPFSVCCVPNGAQVLQLQIHGELSLVWYQSTRGFMRTSYLKPVANGSAPPLPETTSSTSIPPTLPQSTSTVLIIGISGPSGSGKSTLSRSLAERMNSICLPVNADMFFNFAAIAKTEDRSWEHPGGIHLGELMSVFYKLIQCLQSPQHHVLGLSNIGWTNRRGMREEKRTTSFLRAGGVHPILIVEGFLLFYFSEFALKCNVKILWTVSMDVGCRRRFMRQRQGFQTLESFREHFYEAEVWRCYQKYLPQQRANMGQVDNRCVFEIDSDALTEDEVRTVSFPFL